MIPFIHLRRFPRHLSFQLRSHQSSQSSQSSSTTTTSHHNVPICILGGGPVGLLLSSLLTSYHIPHCVVERRQIPTKHPQAHFMNARTMEIIQTHLPTVFHQIRQQMPSSSNWRDFVYGYSVLGKEYTRTDHFSAQETDPGFWSESPTNVVHLPQHKFEHILRQEMNTEKSNLLFGYEVHDIQFQESNIHIRTKNHHSITCQYLIAADGAHSFTRRWLNIPMQGESSLHTLVNVHFTCPGLGKLLQQSHAIRPAMLYFVFNEVMVAVFVAHDPNKDEWVCQIPIFPPFQCLEDYDHTTLMKLLRYGLSGSTSTSSSSSLPTIEIHTINSWTMHAEVAQRFQSSCGRVFLVGDAAHRFPPAGGFGMNTGLQDVHNLAWKLALVTSGKSHPSLLNSYEYERRPIAMSNTALSLRNYDKSAAVARALGLDPSLAKLAVSAASAIPSPTMNRLTATATAAMNIIPLSWRKVAVTTVLDTGLATLSTLKNPHRWDPRILLLRDIVHNGKSLPLIFPKEDIDFAYDGMMGTNHDHVTLESFMKSSANKKSFDSPTKLRRGGRIPHCWFAIFNTTPMTTTTTTTNKREMISSIQLPGNIVSSQEPLSTLVSPSYLPSILLLVDIHHAEMWEKVINQLENQDDRKLFTIIRLQRQQSKPDHHEREIFRDHTKLQHYLQNPCYQSNEQDHPSMNETSRSTSISSIPLPTLSSPFMISKNIVLEDCTGRWNNICTQYRHHHHHHQQQQPPPPTTNGKHRHDSLTSLNDDTHLICFPTVVLRPDGHVLRILNAAHDTNGINHDLIMDQIMTIMSDLHVVMK